MSGSCRGGVRGRGRRGRSGPVPGYAAGAGRSRGCGAGRGAGRPGRRAGRRSRSAESSADHARVEHNGRGKPAKPPFRGSMSEESAMLAEQDLKLVDALQAAPRASWSTLGRALGLGAVTAARRWDALVERGDAWLTAYAAGELTAQLALAFVEIDCAPGATLRVAGELASDVHVVTVECVAGPGDLLVHV